MFTQVEYNEERLVAQLETLQRELLNHEALHYVMRNKFHIPEKYQPYMLARFLRVWDASYVCELLDDGTAQVLLFNEHKYSVRMAKNISPALLQRLAQSNPRAQVALSFRRTFNEFGGPELNTVIVRLWHAEADEGEA